MRKLFKQKRGIEISIEYMMWLTLMFAVLLLATLNFAYSINSSTSFEKNFLSKDIGLLVETMKSTPGDVVIDYERNTKWFAFRFSDEKVEVLDKLPRGGFSRTISTPGGGEYYLNRNSEISINEVGFEPHKTWDKKKSDEQNIAEGASVKLRFCKIGNEIKIGRQGELRCEIV